MPNEAALKFVNEKITAMKAISQELTQIYLSLTDLNEADRFRAKITSINELLFALESARNNIEAAADPVPPPSQERIAALQAALQQLDGYVRSDQNIHMALNYLNQVATMVTTA